MSKSFNHVSRVFNKCSMMGCCLVNGMFTIVPQFNAPSRPRIKPTNSRDRPIFINSNSNHYECLLYRIRLRENDFC